MSFLDMFLQGIAGVCALPLAERLNVSDDLLAQELPRRDSIEQLSDDEVQRQRDAQAAFVVGSQEASRLMTASGKSFLKRASYALPEDAIRRPARVQRHTICQAGHSTSRARVAGAPLATRPAVATGYARLIRVLVDSTFGCCGQARAAQSLERRNHLRGVACAPEVPTGSAQTLCCASSGLHPNESLPPTAPEANLAAPESWPEMSPASREAGSMALIGRI